MKCYIWGTGNATDLFQQGMGRVIQDNPEIEFCGYVNSTVLQDDVQYHGFPVLSPDQVELIAKKHDILILISAWRPSVIHEIEDECKKRGFNYDRLDNYILTHHDGEIAQVKHYLYDKTSVEVYGAIVDCRKRGEYPSPRLCSPAQYFSIPELMAAQGG